ncbi:MAG: galactitol-1-phosphate 5-dehydrogenase [Lachnospiraceae bacterium]|nr:galactitol-1-phosphate 5-dehydrogenase [Lachnospiraceae bacterium]
MKAQVLYGVDDLRYEEREKPVPGEGEVLLKVLAAGICGSDIPRIFRTGAHRHPLVPGHEFSAEVAACGAGTDPALLGKRVGVFPLIPCGECLPCRQKRFEMCRDYDYLGSRCDGAFAEFVTAPADRLILLPEQVGSEAAAMLEPLSVAAHALRRSGFDPEAEQRVALIGLGTIGLMLVMFLREAGCRHIIGVGNKAFQREKFTELTAGIPDAAYLDAGEGNAVQKIRELSGRDGADVVFECVGKSETYAEAIDAAAPGGYVMLIGNPASDMELKRDIYWKILRRQLTVRGSWNSSFTGEADDDWHYVLERIADGRIDPAGLITQRYPLAELDKGLRLMRDKTEDYIKVMMVNRP